jgi:hypothetical protein
MPAGGLNPAAAGSYPSLSSVTSPPPQPPKIEVEGVLKSDHPWVLKAEHGPWFICVKSYSRPHIPTPEDNGPSALALAETLAREIREQHRVQAFLFEYISDERKAEAAAIAAEREKGRVFLQQLEDRKKQSELQGMEFIDDTRHTIHFKTVNYRDQVAVLVGGFQSEEDARKAVEKMHGWEPPKEKILMDGAVVGRPAGDGKALIEKGYLNPYKSVTVVPNPLVPRPKTTQAVSSHLDPFLVKLNEGRPYNLLKATKSWTLAVKAFNAPVEIVGKDTDTSNMRQSNKKGGNALLAGEVQAEKMAEMLREMKGPDGKSLGLEAFVFHTYHSSIVTIGQFDSANDPGMVQVQNLLSSIKINVSEDKQGIKPVMNAPSLFESRFAPMAIPKP